MSDRTGVPVTSSQLATPMIKVVVNTDEEAFLELPPILDRATTIHFFDPCDDE